MAKEIQPIVKNALDGLTSAYVESEGKSKAGRFLRLFLKVIPLSTIIEALVHKNK